MPSTARSGRSGGWWVGALFLLACGGGAEELKGAQPPAGNAPGCEDPDVAYDPSRCPRPEDGDRPRPVRDVTRSPRGNAPNVGDESGGRDARTQGTLDPVPNLGGPVPPGNAPGLEEDGTDGTDGEPAGDDEEEDDEEEDDDDG